jgi:protein-tyrosine-phosphatase
MPSILFVCTANRFRSPLAATYFARQVVRNGDDDNFSISSAGTWATPGQPAMPKLIELAKNFDLNLSYHKSRIVTEEILSQADLILVMETGHKEAITHEFPETADRVFLLTEAVDESPVNIQDPYGPKHASSGEVFREIVNLLDEGYDQIINLGWRMKEMNP